MIISVRLITSISRELPRQSLRQSFGVFQAVDFFSMNLAFDWTECRISFSYFLFSIVLGQGLV